MSDTLMISVSGVRGIVGTDLTPEMMARWAAAFGTWAKTGNGERGRGKGVTVVVGRDARTSGPMFVQAAEAGLASIGCDVISLGLTTTPTAQLAVMHHRAAGGLMFTASHNPIEWNGLKFIGPDGIFLDGDAGARVRDLAEDRTLHRATYDSLGGGGADADAIERHIRAVLRLPGLGVAGIRRRRFRVALDTTRGSGGAIMPQLLRRLGAKVSGVNLATDGRFPRPPEPLPEHLGELGRLVKRTKAHVGIAVDPDVDRMALVDETGAPIGEDYTLAFAVRAVLGGKRESGSGKRVVVCNLSTSLVVDDAARECGASVVRTPVGEVHVARRLLELKAPIGGEGNGGVMHPALHAGRDAPVAAALVLALLARTGKTVSELVAQSPRYAIVKAKIPRGAALDGAYAALRQRYADATVDAQDGLRLAWPDRWLHVRPSNTEPIVRLIAEAPTSAQAERLIQEGRSVCAAS
ncbi:MAG TPA: phosphoglucosamine mutase [Gemmatimonadales bacterium]